MGTISIGMTASRGQLGLTRTLPRENESYSAAVNVPPNIVQEGSACATVTPS